MLSTAIHQLLQLRYIAAYVSVFCMLLTWSLLRAWIHRPCNVYSVLHPKSDLLKWVKHIDVGRVRFHIGTLTVPLSHDHPNQSPHIFLEVVLIHLKGQNDFSAGALLSHCGGPGTNAFCGASRAHSISARSGFKYYALGITQRGVPFFSLSALRAAKSANQGKEPIFLLCSQDTLIPTPEPDTNRFGNYSIDEVCFT